MGMPSVECDICEECLTSWCMNACTMCGMPHVLHGCCRYICSCVSLSHGQTMVVVKTCCPCALALVSTCEGRCEVRMLNLFKHVYGHL